MSNSTRLFPTHHTDKVRPLAFIVQTRSREYKSNMWRRQISSAVKVFLDHLRVPGASLNIQPQRCSHWNCSGQWRRSRCCGFDTRVGGKSKNTDIQFTGKRYPRDKPPLQIAVDHVRLKCEERNKDLNPLHQNAQLFVLLINR